MGPIAAMGDGALATGGRLGYRGRPSTALAAFYYAALRRADIVYSSQVGDGHICIPMCIGLFALFNPIRMPAYFELGVAIILGAGILHLVVIGFWGRLPRMVGVLLTVAYGYFLYKGIIL